MTMQCAITGKKPGRGYSYARRGKAKYLGGVGRKQGPSSAERPAVPQGASVTA